MTKAVSESSALPVAHFVLRLLIVLNFATAVLIVILLVAMPNQRWIMEAFKLDPSPDADRVIFGLRAIAVIGLVIVPVYHLVLKKLLAMVTSVREGDPFVAANAQRLQTIAWSLLVLQLLSIVIGTIAEAISSPAHPVKLDAGFSLTAWLVVLLTFLLARVFAAGTQMRADLEGTV